MLLPKHAATISSKSGSYRVCIAQKIFFAGKKKTFVSFGHFAEPQATSRRLFLNTALDYVILIRVAGSLNLRQFFMTTVLTNIQAKCSVTQT